MCAQVKVLMLGYMNEKVGLKHRNKKVTFTPEVKQNLDKGEKAEFLEMVEG